jgi:hypothetical protein
MDITFLITTYNRRESCQRLVDSLQGLGNIVVVGDKVDYIITGCKFINLPIHYGRTGYLRVVEALWGNRGKADYYFMLPDDFMLMPDATRLGLRLWHEINDPQKICLNLYADRIGMKCWTNFKPADCGSIWQTQWVDMCFLAEEKFFKIFFYSNRHTARGSIATATGSGVGALISRRFHYSKFSLYQVKESLVYPQEEHAISQMHNNENISTYGEFARKGRKPESYRRILGKPGR